jgi:hypothetical protein
MTPVEMEVALRYYYDPYAGRHFKDSPGHQEAIKTLLRCKLLQIALDGIVEPNEPALQVYCEALRAVPLPVIGWVMPS